MGHINKTLEASFNSANNSNKTPVAADNFLDAGRCVIPEWVVYLYFVFIGLGAVVNMIHFLALARCRKNGTLTLIMQLSCVDLLSPYIAVVEIIALNNQAWIFSSENCPLFNGVEVLLNSLMIWLIICLNFHRRRITQTRSHPARMNRTNAWLPKKETANRTLNIDYRKRRNDISVIVPVILIVFVCFSLSIPNFALSSTLKINKGNVLCAILNHYYGRILQKLLLTFRVLVPVPLLLFTFVVLIVKFLQTSPKDIDNILIQKFAEVRHVLLFCITITTCYTITSFQRNVLYFLHGIFYDFETTNRVIFEAPPLYNDQLNKSTAVYLSMLHYSGITYRAFLHLFALPKFQSLIKSKIFVCCKPKE
ncbi:hypothetical protein NQ315_009649 [Exocentrus adspersus]|uniref:G-protein coupled receptors family 1 profile domain-containing protein n=1 Tax=Exocentrus adspersus TaxID=1586481 RepID=A0AAV8WGY5_9CUCU|nr:hypothetical protein NQ315_009649 [Exocentrus adspersus]